MAQGTVRTYDPMTRTGLVLDDDGPEVALAPDALEGSLFIMLRQGQRVVYDVVEVNAAPAATHLRFGQGTD